MKERLFISIYDVSEISGCLEYLVREWGHPAQDDDFTNAVFEPVVENGSLVMSFWHQSMPPCQSQVTSSDCPFPSEQSANPIPIPI
jgi:hypothetical protein